MSTPTEDETPGDPIPNLLAPLRAQSSTPPSISALRALNARRRTRRIAAGALVFTLAALLIAYVAGGTGDGTPNSRIAAADERSADSNGAETRPNDSGGTETGPTETNPTSVPASTTRPGAESPTTVPAAEPGGRGTKRSVRLALDGIPPQFDDVLVYAEAGQSDKTLVLRTAVQGFDYSDCTLTEVTVFDNESIATRTRTSPARAEYEVVAEDGLHTFSVACGSEQLTATRTVRIADRKPERCAGFGFTESDTTATSREDLIEKMTGTWKGCVTTPWLPPYEVTITFNADGTYATSSTESLDGNQPVALYYGSDGADPHKRFDITGFHAGHVGSGTIDIWFANSTTTNTDELTNIRLMGNKLSFEFLHHGQYGPVQLQLLRQ